MLQYIWYEQIRQLYNMKVISKITASLVSEIKVTRAEVVYSIFKVILKEALLSLLRERK